MNKESAADRLVAVIGAGPAGIYAARALAQAGVKVALLNRDIKPGGLAEYGIYYNKFKMKDGLRKQFRQILTDPGIAYRGNVVVGENAQVSLEDLRQLGFQAVLVTVGAQGTKWLGMPGEELAGVYHAKDLVYHYNRLPPFSSQEFLIGQRVALIGVGNVMMDLAHWMIRDLMVEEVVAVARRGPAEVKFTKKEMEIVGANLDLDSLDAEFERVRPVMEGVEQSVESAKAFFLAPLAKAQPPKSNTRFWFDFLASPKRILGDGRGRVCALEVEDTTLVPWNGDTKAKSLGATRALSVDTVIFCIGDRVDDAFGLPVQWNEFVKNPDPEYPVDGISFEAYDPEQKKAIPGVFVAGWAREASSGLVGVARKDGENGARAVLQYLESLPLVEQPERSLEKLDELLSLRSERVVTQEHLLRLYEAERAEAERQGLEEYKLKTNEEMFAAIFES